MDWDKLRVFHAVAEAGSFTHAGETLGLSQSAVSRQIGALEETLNLPLFHRHARGLILTEQGELLFRTAREIFSKLAMTEALLSESRDRPTGHLKITTPMAFGTVWLTPCLKEFMDIYPEIHVSLLLVDGELDLAMREADVAIWMLPPKQDDLISRHLLTVNFNIYASPDYVKRRGMPQNVEELDDHNIIVYGESARFAPPFPSANWLLEVGADPLRPRRPILEINNIYAINRAVRAGIGIAALPDYMNQEADNLVQLLPGLVGPTMDAYFVFPEEMRNSKRITVFRDFLLHKIHHPRP